MANKKSILSRVRLRYRHSSPLLKCVVLAAVVLSTICLMVIRSAILETEAKKDALRQEAAQLTQENQQIEEDTQQLGTVQSIIAIAMEKLGLMLPDSIRFLPND